MSKLVAFLAREKRLLEQAREIAALRETVQGLRAENAKINNAMRRCIPCEYRLKVLSDRSSAGVEILQREPSAANAHVRGDT